MPYLQLELDAKKGCQLVARTVGVEPGLILWGLTDLWEICFRSKSATLHRACIVACFGKVAGMEEALAAFGFIELSPDDTIRVKGADRLFKARAAQAEAGRKSAANLKQNRLPSGSPPGQPGDKPESKTGSYTQQPSNQSPNIKEAEAPLPPKPDDPFASPEAFWAEAQQERREQGLITEKPPHPAKLSRWWSEVHLELEGNPQPLAPAYLSFVRDKFWRQQKPPAPFNGFISQWRNYVPTHP